MPRRTLAGEVESHELEARARGVERRKRPFLGRLDGQPLEIPAGPRLIHESREDSAFLIYNQPDRNPDVAADALAYARWDFGDLFMDVGRLRGVGW
jgi:hypothetical protein